jgi:integrase
MAWKFKQPGSNNWWIGYRLNGQQYRRSTGTADEQQADREIAKLNNVDQAHKAGSLTEEFFRHLTNSSVSSEPLLPYVDQWIGECKDLSPVTIKKYRDSLEEFGEYLNATKSGPLLKDIRTETIGAFLRKKRSDTSTATAKLTRRILSAFFNYAVDNAALHLNPVPSAKSLKLTKDSKSLRRAFTLTELKTLHSKAPNDFWRYMVLGGFYTALRMGDLITMPWGALDFDQNIIRLTTRKTGTPMKIPIRPELGALLRRIRKAACKMKPSDPIWPEQAERYGRHGAGVFSNEFYEEVLLPAGLVSPRTHHAKSDGDTKSKRRQLNAVSFHCLRHTFVSLVKVTGGSQAVAKELAGHSSDVVSDLYTHVPEEALTKAIAKLPAMIP